MAPSLSSHMSHSPLFDKRTFLKQTTNIGKAYRNQAMELIFICQVFSFSRTVEQSYRQDAALSDVLQVCDSALARIAEARERESVQSAHWIKLAKRKLEVYEETYHLSKRNNPNSQSVRERLDEAMNKDKEEFGPVLRSLFTSKTHRTRPKDASRIVKFHLLKSITDTRPTLVQQAFTNVPNMQDILWNFSRYPASSVTLSENPHFYYHHHLPIKSPNTYNDGFTIDPVDSYQDVNDIYVLKNMPGRVFLECGKKSRAFDNVWRTKGIFIFKDVCGKLDGERIVGAPIQGRPCKWCRIEPPSSQREDWANVQDWRDAILHVLDSQDAKIRITVLTESAAGLLN